MMFKNSPWTEKKEDGSKFWGTGAHPFLLQSSGSSWLCLRGIGMGWRSRRRPRRGIWEPNLWLFPAGRAGPSVKGKEPAPPACSMDLSVSTAPLLSRSPTWEGLALLPQRPEMCFPKRLQCQVAWVFGANSGGFAERVILWGTEQPNCPKLNQRAEWREKGLGYSPWYAVSDWDPAGAFQAQKTLFDRSGAAKGQSVWLRKRQRFAMKCLFV